MAIASRFLSLVLLSSNALPLATAGPLEVTNTNDSGAGSLRAAIEYAAKNAAEDAITFNIPGTGPHTISLLDKFPDLKDDGISIDGTTQPGAACGQLTTGSSHTLMVQIEGNQEDIGFKVDAANVTIKGLSIVDFKKEGIEVTKNGDGALIECVYVGVETDGTTGNAVAVEGGTKMAVLIKDSLDVTIRNSLVSGNATEPDDYAIWADKISGTIEGNIIGLNASGTGSLPNGAGGIYVKEFDVAPLTIGGFTASKRNVISGNGGHGIFVDSNVDAINIFGNYIGLGQNGTSAFGNGMPGVFVDKGSFAALLQNRIAHNSGLGIDLDEDQDLVNSNDSGDVDDGANDRLNYPVLTEIGANGTTSIWYDFSLDTESNVSGYRIEFYKNTNADPSGFGEGEIYLGAVDVSHSGGVHQYTGFTTATNTVSIGDQISATTIRKTGPSTFDATSEFSQSVTSLTAPIASLIATSSMSHMVASTYSIPGEQLNYTITITNEGEGPVDTDKIVLIEKLGDGIVLFNGDYDGTGPSTDRIGFFESGTGLSFSPLNDVRFSSSATQPASWDDCTYIPAAGFDANVRFVCFNPKGSMAFGDPDPSFSLIYRARID